MTREERAERVLCALLASPGVDALGTNPVVLAHRAFALVDALDRNGETHELVETDADGWKLGRYRVPPGLQPGTLIETRRANGLRWVGFAEDAVWLEVHEWRRLEKGWTPHDGGGLPDAVPHGNTTVHIITRGAGRNTGLARIFDWDAGGLGAIVAYKLSDGGA